MPEELDQLTLLLETRAAIREYAEANLDTRPWDVAAALIDGLDERQRWVLAYACIQDTADVAQRLCVRRTEDRAERPREAVVKVAPEEQEAVAAILSQCRFKKTTEQAVAEVRATRREEERVLAEWQRHRDSPEAYAAVPGLALTQARERRAFREWMGDAFPAWLERLKSAWGERRRDDNYHYALSHWHPSGYEDYYHELRVEEVTAMVHRVAAQVRLETTEELLSSVFALGDGGERVTWGEATTEQHQKRIELLVGNAAGNVETAARHQAAIRMISEAGAGCLREAAERTRPAPLVGAVCSPVAG